MMVRIVDQPAWIMAQESFLAMFTKRLQSLDQDDATRLQSLDQDDVREEIIGRNDATLVATLDNSGMTGAEVVEAMEEPRKVGPILRGLAWVQAVTLFKRAKKYTWKQIRQKMEEGTFWQEFFRWLTEEGGLQQILQFILEIMAAIAMFL